MAGWNIPSNITPSYSAPNYTAPPTRFPTSYEPPGYIGVHDVWLRWNAGQPIHQIVCGSQDLDGSPIYVGREFYNGDNIPCKVVPNRNIAYICWGGKEIELRSCEILQDNGRYGWIPSSCGMVPPQGVPVGRTKDGETLYAGKVLHNGSFCIGKVHPSHGCLYIPFGGKEHSHKQYDVLVRL